MKRELFLSSLLLLATLANAQEPADQDSSDFQSRLDVQDEKLLTLQKFDVQPPLKLTIAPTVESLMDNSWNLTDSHTKKRKDALGSQELNQSLSASLSTSGVEGSYNRERGSLLQGVSGDYSEDQASIRVLQTKSQLDLFSEKNIVDTVLKGKQEIVGELTLKNGFLADGYFIPSMGSLYSDFEAKSKSSAIYLEYGVGFGVASKVGYQKDDQDEFLFHLGLAAVSKLSFSGEIVYNTDKFFKSKDLFSKIVKKVSGKLKSELIGDLGNTDLSGDIQLILRNETSDDLIPKVRAYYTFTAENKVVAERDVGKTEQSLGIVPIKKSALQSAEVFYNHTNGSAGVRASLRF